MKCATCGAEMAGNGVCPNCGDYIYIPKLTTNTTRTN